MKVLYFAVDDSDYPRNRSIRLRLEADGHEVVVLRKRRTGSYVSRGMSLLREALVLSRGDRRYDVILLAEFSAQYSPFAWLASRLFSATFVHDYFVGLIETNVEDWSTFSARSPRGRIHGLLDRLAIRLPDLVIRDTSPRTRDTLRKTSACVATFPVESPPWATWLGPSPAKDVPTVLFYGNFIPLHGIPTILKATVGLPINLQIIGRGPGRNALEREYGGPARNVVFEEPVSEDLLVQRIRAADVVLGVFGASTKAATVIPNKVWQGLSSGRVVITRRSDAYLDLPILGAGEQLIQVPEEDPAALRAALQDVIDSRIYRQQFSESDQVVRDYVDATWRDLSKEIVRQVHQKQERGRGRGR